MSATLPPDPQQALALVAEAPWRWDFFQALRWVDARMPTGTPRLGCARRPGDEPVRLAQTPDLAFAPASIDAVDLHPQGGGVPRLTVRFFGLFGPNGPLPLHLTAYARERLLHKGDHTLARFADLFHHRLLLLFYRAWAQAQPTANLDRPEHDRYADWVGSLIGMGGTEWRGRDAAPSHAKLFHAGVLSRQVRNADGLEALVGGTLRLPVRVQSFVGRWMRLLPRERTRLGKSRGGSAQLGRGAVLGGTVFDRQHHFRLHVGPLDDAQFQSMLPTGGSLAVTKALVDQYVGDELGWDVRLQLAAPQGTPCSLGRKARLGWTSWLGSSAARRGPRGRDTAFLILDPQSARSPH